LDGEADFFGGRRFHAASLIDAQPAMKEKVRKAGGELLCGIKPARVRR
jgi:hypothetical protein